MWDQKRGLVMITAVACLVALTLAVTPLQSQSKFQSLDVASLQNKANEGDAAAQYELGLRYQNGTGGVATDYSKAFVWYRKAADQGNPDAQCMVGKFYHFGFWGVPRDPAQAAIWYRKAADQGNASAQNNLGGLYDLGLGVPRDHAQAMIWIRKAADQGLVAAQTHLQSLAGQSVRAQQPSCDPNWSPQWNQLASERQEVLRQPGAVDRMISMGGGLEAIAADEKLRSEEDDAQVFQQAQGQGQVPSGMSSQEYTAFRRGLIDIYHCRKGAATAPTTAPVTSVRQTASLNAPRITNCQEAAYYRDHQLVKDFDAAMAQYNIFKDGKLNQQKIKIESLKLMDTEWWGGKTAVQAAIEIKLYTHLFNDTVGWLLPEEYFEQLYGKTAVQSFDLVQHDAIALDAAKKEAEEGAKKAAEDTFKEYAKEVIGQVGSLIGIYDDLKEHNEDRAKLAKAEASVQKIAENIERTINRYDNRMQESMAKTQAIADVVAAIDQVCAPLAIDVKRP